MVVAESGAPLSRPWCANPRALGGAREDPPRPSVPSSAIPPEGRAGAGTFRAALPAPDQASAQPSPVACPLSPRHSGWLSHYLAG